MEQTLKQVYISEMEFTISTTMIPKINNKKITSIVIASILLIGSLSMTTTVFGHAQQTSTTLGFDSNPVSEGTPVEISGIVTALYQSPAGVNPEHPEAPVDGGDVEIQQGVDGAENPVSECGTEDHWIILDTVMTDSNGEYSYNFPTDGLAGQTLIFQANYLSSGGQHNIVESVSECNELEITATPEGCDETGQLCKTTVITEEIEDGVITVNELIQYDFTIDLTNSDGQSWFYVTLYDHGFGGDLAVGDGLVEEDDPRDIDAMVLTNLDCELTQKGKTDKEKLDCIVDDQETYDAIDPTGDEELHDGESASVEVTAFTDFNPGQSKKDIPKREYTSCGIHSPNEGAVVEYFLEGEDPEIDDPHVLATPAIYVEVYDHADLTLGDCDNDTVNDAIDNCPFTSNVDQADNYGSDLGDACEDTDEDSILDDIDNCPETSNAGQEDFDDDGVGDVCNDANDADGDEVDDSIDLCPGTDPTDTPIDPVNGCGMSQLPP